MARYGALRRHGVALLAAAVLLSFAAAAPAVEEEEVPGNMLEQGLSGAGVGGGDPAALGAPWEAFDLATLRNLLLQMEADERERASRAVFGPRQTRSRVSKLRAWQAGGGGPRALGGGDNSRWLTDKRQVRFRQCYFNPISCFRK